MKHLLIAAMLVGLHAPAHAAGQALVIGIGQYAGQSTLPSCSQSAHDVSARLRRLGFTVDEAVDASAATLRETLVVFAGHLAASATTPPLAYICAEADLLDQRVFLLPTDVDLQQPLHPETQGIVVKALFNAFAGTDGTVVAEFALSSGRLDAAAAAVRAILPAGMHLVVAAGDGRQTGALGIRLADAATPLDQGWFGLATALQQQHVPSGSTAALYAPLPVPPPPPPPPAPPINTIPAVAPAQPPAVRPVPSPAPPRPRARVPLMSHPSKPVPVQRAPDDKVRRLQGALARLGFYRGALDGIADALTGSAVRRYQASLGDQATGQLTQSEIIKLLNDW